MSQASKCDKCNGLFEPEKGCVSLEVSVVSKPPSTCTTWSEVDFCPGCSKLVLDVIAKALQGLKRPR